MGHLTYGYRLNPRGRVEHRTFDSEDLLHGEGARNGWVDSPSKIPGAVQAIQAEAEAKAATAHTTSPEPKLTGAVHGEEPKRKPGWPKGKPRK